MQRSPHSTLHGSLPHCHCPAPASRPAMPCPCHPGLTRLEASKHPRHADTPLTRKSIIDPFIPRELSFGCFIPNYCFHRQPFPFIPSSLLSPPSGFFFSSAFTLSRIAASPAAHYPLAADSRKHAVRNYFIPPTTRTPTPFSWALETLDWRTFNDVIDSLR